MAYFSENNYITISEENHVGGRHSYLHEDGKMNYVIPIVQWVTASSDEEAKIRTTELPRVGHYQKHSVLYYGKASFFECLLAKCINDFDEYLTSSTLNGSYESIQERRMVSRRYVEALQKEYLKTGKEMYLEKLLSIKTADRFSDEYPLQQHFAPVWSDGMLVYQKRDIKKTLSKYFTLMTQKVAMAKIENVSHFMELRKKMAKSSGNLPLNQIDALHEFENMLEIKAVILMLYYKLYGKNNPLGIRYDAENHQMQYIADSRNSCKLPKTTSIEQAKIFFESVLGKENPLKIEYNEKEHSISFDAQKLEVKVNPYAFDLPDLYKKLFCETLVNSETGKKRKIYHDPLNVFANGECIPFYNYDKALTENKKLNLQNLYALLFHNKMPNSNKTFDPLRTTFDAKNNTITFRPAHIVKVNIPKITYSAFSGKKCSTQKEDVLIEEFFMAKKVSPVYKEKEETFSSSFEPPQAKTQNTRVPNAVEKFNARLQKAREFQGK